MLFSYHQEKKWDIVTLSNFDFAIKKSKEWNVHHNEFGGYHSEAYFCKKFVLYIDSIFPGFDVKKTDLGGFDFKTDRAVAFVLKKNLLWFLFPCLKFFGHPGLRNVDFGTSLKSFLHICQHVIVERRYSKKLYAYYHGSEENKQKYGTEECPEYDLTNINIPISIIVGSTDKSCNLEAAQVFAELVNTHNKNENLKCFCLENYRHASFLYPKDKKPVAQIFDKILG